MFLRGQKAGWGTRIRSNRPTSPWTTAIIDPASALWEHCGNVVKARLGWCGLATCVRRRGRPPPHSPTTPRRTDHYKQQASKTWRKRSNAFLATRWS